jgi:tRNA pseudouridine38-40 synthase
VSIRRYFLRMSFEGSAFHGWQIQENAHTVQAELNNALKILLKKETETVGCGRTDTGVHARMFFVHFDTDDLTDVNKFVHQLTAILPAEIAVQSVFETDVKAHARFSAVERTYQYLIHQQKDPFLRDRSYFFPYSPDVEKMNRLTEVLKEYTDFSCFSKSNTQTFTNNCIISSAGWKKEGEEIIFTISANRFLRNMVRAITGTFLKAGLNESGEKEIREILESKNRSEAGMSVPAHGLYLTEIKYPFPVY